MQLQKCSLLILTLLTVSLPAQASEWYPIDTGRLWIYSSLGGGSITATVEDPEWFAGWTVQPLRWDTDVREQFSQDGSGRVFMHGVIYPDGGYVVFDPPILRMDSDLTLGHEWETITDIIEYNADGEEVFRLWQRSTFLVIGVGPVDVAAGTFRAAEVLRTEETGPLARAATSSSASFPSSVPQGVSPAKRSLKTYRETFAEGIGLILRTNENGTLFLLELEACGANGVPTEDISWGAVKSLFKN